nr:hypothetical protein [Tanacetum cinerariifolium]
MCHIIGIEPQFENITLNGPFIPMAAGQRKPEAQWTGDERKAANLDQRLKSLIMSVLPDDQMNSVINFLTVKSTWDDLILYNEGPSDVKESRVMDLKLCYNTFKFKEGESLTQTFTRYKALMNKLVNDGIKLSKLEINTGFINGLPKKWLSFCQSLKNTNHVKDSELASLFGKLKYEENLIDNSSDDEEDTRSSHEYLNDLDEEYQAKALLDKSKRFFKKGTQSSSASALNSFSSKNKGLIVESHDWDEEEVSSDDEETEVKALMALIDEERIYVGKESTRNGECTKITIKSNLHKSSEAEDSTLPNHDTDEVPLNKSQRNTIDPSVVVSDSPAPGYDSANESSVCSTPLLLLKKLDGAEPTPARGNKSSLASKTNSSPAGKLKNVNVEDDPALTMHHTGQGKSSSRSRPSRPSVSYPSCIHCGYNNHHSDDCLYYPTCEICGRYDRNTHDYNKIISQRRGINPRNPQHVTKNCETCSSNVHTTSDQNDIEWFKKRETPHAKKAKSSNALRSKTPTKRGIYGEVGLNTFRNAIGAHYLPHSSKFVTPPSIDVVRKCFPMIGYGEEEDIILKLKKKQFKKVVPYTRFLSLLIMHKMKEDYGTDEPGAKNGHKKPANSPKQPSVSSKEATKGGSSKAPIGSKTGHSKRRKESSSAMDSNLNRPSVSTPVDTKIHKDDQQASGSLTSLGVTSKERANPQLSSDFIAEADPGLSGHNDFLPPQQDQTKSISKGLKTILTQPTIEKRASSTAIHGDKEKASIAIHGDKEEASSTIKLEDLAKLVSQIQPSFKDLDSPEDDHVIIVDKSDEDEPNSDTEDTLVPRSSSPSSLATKLKELPSKFNELTEEIKGLQTQVHELEIKLPKELKEIPTKLEDFAKNATDLASQVAKLKTLQWELSKEFLSLPAKSTTPSTTTPINPPIITTTTQMQTPLQSPPRSSSQPEGEHIKKDKGKKVISLKEAEKESIESDSDEEVHVTSAMVKSYKEKRLKKFDFVTKDGRHDGTYEVIPNFKVSDLHLGEWREVMKACTDIKGNGWKTIYDQVQTRMDYLHTTEAELSINLDIPLSMQDPLDKLNDLANKKRKHADDIHDYFKATKMLKSSVECGDHLPGTMLNEPVLGMIMFSSYHRQDFVTIEDLKDFSNVMLYTVQEIFFS